MSPNDVVTLIVLILLILLIVFLLAYIFTPINNKVLYYKYVLKKSSYIDSNSNEINKIDYIVLEIINNKNSSNIDKIQDFDNIEGTYLEKSKLLETVAKNSNRLANDSQPKENNMGDVKYIPIDRSPNLDVITSYLFGVLHKKMKNYGIKLLSIKVKCGNKKGFYQKYRGHI